jgi:hypothetical protein|tara:strand:- start:202 stop:846 length:645 start_codon:yes stop_codon:yes gene_type:complete
MNKIEFQFLPNLPIARVVLDKDKMEKIYNECINLKDYESQKFTTGLQSYKTPIHYRMRECNQLIQEEVLGIGKVYQEKFDIFSRNLTNSNPDLLIDASDIWVNYQKKGDYLPLHLHEGLLSWVLWVQIPYDIEKEREIDNTGKGGKGNTSCFAFNYSTIDCNLQSQIIPVSKKEEGTLLMFPSKLQHLCYPFYTSDGERISISGNLKYRMEVVK